MLHVVIHMPSTPGNRLCAKCFSKLDELVEVSDKGTLVSYTVVHSAGAHYPVEPPFAYGIIQLDGADTALAHILGEVGFENIKVGMRVQAVFKDERKGHILDIKYFKPL